MHYADKPNSDSGSGGHYWTRGVTIGCELTVSDGDRRGEGMSLDEASASPSAFPPFNTSVKVEKNGA